MEIKEICSYRESLQLNFILVLFLRFLYLARWKNERKQARSLRFTNGKIKTTKIKTRIYKPSFAQWKV